MFFGVSMKLLGPSPTCEKKRHAGKLVSGCNLRFSFTVVQRKGKSLNIMGFFEIFMVGFENFHGEKQLFEGVGHVTSFFLNIA